MTATLAIQEKVINRVETLLKNLTIRGIGDNVQPRKLPAVEEEIDTLPMLAIAPADEAELVERADFEGGLFKTYALELVAITKGKKLLTLENLDDPNQSFFERAYWRETVVNLFRNPTVLKAAIPQVLGCSAVPGKPIDRQKLNQAYEYSSVVLRVRTKE